MPDAVAMVSLLWHRMRLDFGARRTIVKAVLISPFQLFTNGQRQFAQKVDTGSNPEAIICSFRLRNPDVAEDRSEIELNRPVGPARRGSRASRRSTRPQAAWALALQLARLRRMYRLVQTLTAFVSHSSYSSPDARYQI
ncbi:hypothetical protein [Paraburkholderia terrae]